MIPARRRHGRWGARSPDSAAATTSRSSVASVPPTGTTSATLIVPVVRVPVLSSTIVSTSRVDSRISGPLMRMPSSAPRPVPTSRAVGVARPSAQGQAMIRTATAVVMAVLTPAPVSAQTTPVTSAMTMTTGTKMPETRSARRCTAALPVCACSTRRAICESWVSAPTRVACTSRRPVVFTVPPTTAEPGETSTGTDSPVIRDASIAERPSTTRPSAAIFSPGRTTMTSSTLTRSAGTRVSTPSRSRVACLAPSLSRASSAEPASRRARASK